MQGVAGSKGGQVYGYDVIASIASVIPTALEILETKNISPPPLPSSEFFIDIDAESPLGVTDQVLMGSRINLRNSMHEGDASQTPLQFVYEASNCKLFYTAADQYEISGLWKRVANVAWGNGTCVPGSTVTKDNSFPAGAYDTVPFGKSAYSTVEQPYQPGLVAQKSEI